MTVTGVSTIVILLMTVASGEICTGPVCSYTFDVSTRSSHIWHDGRSTKRVGLNGSTLVTKPNSYHPLQPEIPIPDEDVQRVVTLDGHLRDVIHINGQFPGPTIEVMEGVQVIIISL